MLSLALAALMISGPTETAVSVPTDRAPLHGSLLTPAGETRAVAVMIPGSGPTDRDGNQLPAIRAGYLKQLAEALAADGIASIRVDKRGAAASAFAAGSESDLRFEHYVADALSWVAQAVKETGQPCAWLIGHSEGSLVVLAAAAQDESIVCGVISLAGAGRPAHEVVAEQFEVLPEGLREAARETLAQLAAGQMVEAPPAELAGLFRASAQPYLMSWLPLDPAEQAVAFDRPLFIGQGTADLQVPVGDAERLSAARPDATLAVWEGVNHVLKIAPEDREGNAATYGDPDLPLAPGVAEDVAAFILAPR